MSARRPFEEASRARDGAIGSSPIVDGASLASVENAWPGLNVDKAAFVSFVECIARASDDDTRPRHLADLYLAFACVSGCRMAHRAFDEHFLADVGTYVRSIDRSPAFAEDVRQELRGKLLLPAEDGSTKLGTYTGRGPLAGWVRVAAIRTARNIVRGGKAVVDVSDEQLGERVVGEENPELAYLKARGAQSFRDAFERALEALTPRDKAILRLSYIERMSTQDIGRMYGVTGAAVRVWLKAVRETIGASVRRALGGHLAADSQELRQLVALVESRFDLTLSRILERDDSD